jgi:transcription initiation factor IIE alpha subunit
MNYEECLLGYVRQALFAKNEAKDTELARELSVLPKDLLRVLY